MGPHLFFNTDLVGNKIAKAIQHKEATKFGGKVIAPFLMCKEVLFCQLIPVNS